MLVWAAGYQPLDGCPPTTPKYPLTLLFHQPRRELFSAEHGHDSSHPSPPPTPLTPSPALFTCPLHLSPPPFMQARPVHCGAPAGSAAVHDGREERDGQVAPRPAAVSTGECGGGGGAVDPAFYSRALYCVSPPASSRPPVPCMHAHRHMSRLPPGTLEHKEMSAEVTGIMQGRM